MEKEKKFNDNLLNIFKKSFNDIKKKHEYININTI